MANVNSLIFKTKMVEALVAFARAYVQTILGLRSLGRGKVEVRQRSKTKQQIGIAL